jgi:hypothetical protein
MALGQVSLQKIIISFSNYVYLLPPLEVGDNRNQAAHYHIVVQGFISDPELG